MIPAYLRDPPIAEKTYGTLSYNRRARCWTIHGDPMVTELVKRLFPSADGYGRGQARFPAHRRIFQDLNWLMLRYPLEIAERDRERYHQSLEEARDWAQRRTLAEQMPEQATPPEGAFSGTLRPFQERGLAHLLANERTLLADEMGLGKTVEALAAIATLHAYPALVVVPPHLVRNWIAESKRFLNPPDGLSVHVIRGLTPYALPPADLYIIHYLLLRGWKETLSQLHFEAILFDEVQELRHAGTEKYSAASLLSSSCQRVYGLSGTPIYNRGGEIYNVVNILDFHCLGTFESFSREWCDGYGRDTVLKPELLGAHLKHEGLMLRRTKAEVLSELLPKRRLVQEIDADDVLYRQLIAGFAHDLLRLHGEMPAGERALLEIQVSQRERQATGLAKASYVAAFVKALLEGGEKVLLFAHHHAVMDAYRKSLAAFHPVFVTGRENEADKDRAVTRFMQGETDLCCISLRAASGLNLQRATCVVFGELDWSPAVHSQAEDRAHRIGQVDSLLCYYLVSPQGSDADIQDALGLKVSQFVGLMGDTTQGEGLREMLSMDARKHAEQLVSRYLWERESMQ